MKPTKEQFIAYVDVQMSGLTNMFDNRMVNDLSSKYYQVEIPNDVHSYIMKNYAELKAEYGDGSDR